MSELTRQIIDSILPKGVAWDVAVGLDFDKYLEGDAENYDDIIDFLSKLAFIRNPFTTPIELLGELEIEYGVSFNSSLTEEQRRSFLASIVFAKDENGERDTLEDRLNQAGFPVQVHQNDKAIDPEIIRDNNFSAFCGNESSVCGNETAFCQRIGGELIVNGDRFKQVPLFTTVCGNPDAVCGNETALCGASSGLVLFKIDYNTPTDPANFPFVFFIGGDATKDGQGFITDIERIILPPEARKEFIKIVLKYKPIYTWALSVVDFM